MLYEGRLVGLKVALKDVSGLQTRVNITMNITDVTTTYFPLILTSVELRYHWITQKMDKFCVFFLTKVADNPNASVCVLKFFNQQWVSNIISMTSSMHLIIFFSYTDVIQLWQHHNGSACLLASVSFSSQGCLTLWERGQSHVTCSCDHLTIFGVLLVGPVFLFVCELEGTASVM